MSAPIAGAVTAVVGMFFQIPPQYGYMIGSTLWGVTHPAQYEGPKLADLKVLTSQYGIPIPNIYGAVRVSGNIIWSIPLVQVGTTESQKGGAETTTYKQYAYFALGLCEGVIDGIGRIWVNNKLYATNNKNASFIDILNSSRKATITVYKGHEDQEPDPTIQSYAGVENTSGYQGLAYLVIEGMEYESRGLNVEVEVFKDGQVFYVSDMVYEVDNYQNMKNIGGVYYPSISQKNQLAYVYGFYTELEQLMGQASYGIAIVNPDGSVKPLRNLTKGAGIADVEFSYNSKSTDGSILWTGRELVSYEHRHWVVYSDGTIVPLEPYLPQESFGIQNVISVKDSESMFVCAYDSATQNKLCKIEFYGQQPNNGFHIELAYRVRDLAIGNTYLFVLDASGNIRRYDLDLNFIDVYYNNNDAFWYWNCITNDNDTVYAAHNFDIYKIDSGNVRTKIASTLSTGAGPNILYFQNDNFYFRGGGPTNKKLYMCARTTDGEDIPISTIVTDLCEKATLTPSEVEVDSISDKYLRGYIINGVMATGSAIEQLATYFMFDNAESDDKIKFVARGKNKPIIIPEEDLAAHISGSELPDDLAISRKQSLELPQKITLKFMDTDADYQISSQFSRRYVVESQNSQTVEAAVVQTGTQARRMADTMLAVQWLDRRTYTLQLSDKYLYLEVNDVLQTTKDGDIHLMRITEINYQNNILTISATAEDPEIYESYVTGAPSGYRANDTVYAPSSTDLYFLDIPLLRDQDDGVGYYLTANGFQPNNWSGTQVYKSLDNGASFMPYGSFINRKGLFGQCQTILGDWKGGPNLDITNTLTVRVNGALSSTSMLNVNNGSNVACVGKEIIQYEYAESKGEGVYLLHGLYRGCFGTEQHISTHGNGEVFVFLAPQTLYLESSNTAEYGLERQYKGLSNGETLGDAITVKFTNNAVAQKPYSPVHLGGGRNGAGDAKLKWIRRTRIGGTWRDSVDVPLGETTEAYSVDIIRPDGTVARTLDSTVQNVMYTAAQQTADFGSVQSSIKFTVYQISSTVGRGFGATSTI